MNIILLPTIMDKCWYSYNNYNVLIWYLHLAAHHIMIFQNGICVQWHLVVSGISKHIRQNVKCFLALLESSDMSPDIYMHRSQGDMYVNCSLEVWDTAQLLSIHKHAYMACRQSIHQYVSILNKCPISITYLLHTFCITPLK